MQRKVGENDEATEGYGHREHFEDGHLFDPEYAEIGEYSQAQEGEYEVQTGQRHVRIAIVDVNVFVQLDDGHRGDQIDQQTPVHVHFRKCTI